MGPGMMVGGTDGNDLSGMAFGLDGRRGDRRFLWRILHYICHQG